MRPACLRCAFSVPHAIVFAAPLLLFFTPTAAHAQTRMGNEFFLYGRSGFDREAFDVQLFEPSPSPRSITTLDLAQVPTHLQLTLSLFSNYARDPFVVGLPDGTTRPIVQDLWQTELHASLGLFNYFELGAAMPLTFDNHPICTTNGSECTGLDSNFTLQNALRPGDLRAYVKVPIVRGAWPIAVRLGASFPTGGHDAFAGNVTWTFTPALVASHAFGPVDVALNAGYRFRQRNGIEGDPSFVLDDEVLWGAGARYNITPRVGINAELTGRIGVSAGGLPASRLPVEVLAGGTFQLSDAVSLQLGAGRGLSAGYGAEEVRVYGGVRVTLTRTSCTTGPEDYDGFQDGDFCDDPDNDGDGIPDALDRCPNDPEDRDGFQDEDGCPDPDNDADGVADAVDHCPNQPEDFDGFEDADGCPENDNDRDGIDDNHDRCPNEPEDLDGYEDEDGCPEPGPEAAVVTRTESHLLLSQRIFFDYDSDTIRSVSLPILNEVANTLRRNPDITRVRIEGYTDGQGDRQYNVDLSYRRARAVVEYLVSQGVPREHLEYQGYGPSHPVADDRTPEGQALNRRVEFTIVAQGGEAAPRPSGTRSATSPAGR